MQKRKLVTGFGITTLVIAGALFLESCSNKITEEQLLQLKELRKQEAVLADQVKRKQDEKNKLEAELKARKAELNKCQDQVDFIKKKLALWPDIWPDWKPDDTNK